MEPLSAQELRRFAADGFVVRRNALDAGLMEAARDLFWQSAAADGTGLDPVDRATWYGPLPAAAEQGAAVHGMPVNFARGFIYKERACGGSALLRQLLPAAAEPVARQLLGDDLLPAGGENAELLLGAAVTGDKAGLSELADSSDVGVGPVFARYLNCIADSRIGDIEYGKTSGAKDDIGALFVTGSRSRGIYATLPQPGGGPAGSGEAGGRSPHPAAAARRQHQNTSGLLEEQPPAGHVDIFPFQLGCEACACAPPPPHTSSPQQRVRAATRRASLRPTSPLLITSISLRAAPPPSANLTRCGAPPPPPRRPADLRRADLDDVPPGGGGLLLWPGSHRRLYRRFTRSLSFDPDPTMRCRQPRRHRRRRPSTAVL